MRLVLDTNIVVSGSLWGGVPHRLLAMVVHHANIIAFSSPRLIEELSDVLARDYLAKRVLAVRRTQSGIVQAYLNAVELATPPSVPRVIADDPDDDHVLALAHTVAADMIVSGDRKHLLPLGSYHGIPILSASDALLRITT